MKKISLTGLILGMFLGAIAGALAGSWIFWLGGGLAMGVVLGSVIAKRSLIENGYVRRELKL